MFEKIYTQDELKRINDARTAIPGHRYIDTWGNNYIGTSYRKINSLAGTSAVWGNITGSISDQTDIVDLFATKQDLLVSGVNIKTINGASILGPGDLLITGWVESVTDDGNGVVSVDNTDPLNPIINFNGVNVDGTTITGDGTAGTPLSVVPDTTYTVSTTDATVTTIQTIAIPNNTGLLIRSFIKSRKTGGVGVGTTGDVNGYVRTVKAKNVAGVVTIGVISSDYTSEDIAPFNATFVVSGTNVLVRVTGSANNNVDWECKTETL